MGQRYVCSTAGCGRLADRPKCDKHRRESEHRQNDVGRRRYRTARWARLRKSVLSRDLHLCCECQRQGRTRIGTEIDHVKPWSQAPERFWDPENLETLCKACHSQKTRRGA
jgi:5-methylcytosine-specific restriction protein A